MRIISNKLFLFILPMLLAPGFTGATEVVAGSKSDGPVNMALVSLVGIILVLAFAIAVLTNVLSQLTLVYRDRIRAEKQGQGGGKALKAILFLLTFSIPSFHAFAAGADSTVRSAVAPILPGITNYDFYWIIGIIILELIVIAVLLYYIRIFAHLISNRPATTKVAKAKARVAFWDRFNNLVPIEKEKDIMLDHDYDGIRELDNSLPPWWKYGFYLTIVVAFVYIYRYHVSASGPSSHDEYVAEMQQAEEDKAAYLALSANNIDENTVVLLKDAADVSAGQQVFQSTCMACHAKDGGGGVGPNLTDDYWLHGGGIKDIFKSIKYGWQEKGMKSWKDDFSPKQMAQLTAYIKTLQGTKPAAPKDKQGELYIEANDAPKGAAADSSKAGKVAVN